MSMDWFRWYAGTATNPKWQLVASDAGQPVAFVIAVWAHILERANVNNGTIEGWNGRVVAVAIGASAEAVSAIFDAMQGLVLDGLLVTGWTEHQPKRRDDDSSERVRAHRARKRNVTQCNAEEHTETLEEIRVDKKEEDADASSKKAGQRGSRLPDGAVLPDEWAAFARTEGHSDPEREWAKFTDYWRAQPGSKGVKLDWEATWRNWVRRSCEDGKRTGSKPQRKFGPDLDEARRATLAAHAIHVGRNGGTAAGGRGGFDPGGIDAD